MAEIVDQKAHPGLCPRKTITRYRLLDLLDAMIRKTGQEEPIPAEWIEEVEELSQWMRKQADKPKKQWI